MLFNACVRLSSSPIVSSAGSVPIVVSTVIGSSVATDSVLTVGRDTDMLPAADAEAERLSADLLISAAFSESVCAAPLKLPAVPLSSLDALPRDPCAPLSSDAEALKLEARPLNWEARPGLVSSNACAAAAACCATLAAWLACVAAFPAALEALAALFAAEEAVFAASPALPLAEPAVPAADPAADAAVPA